MASTTYVYVGTYTRPAPYLGATNGKGIYVFRMDPATGKLSPAGECLGIDSPSYLNVDPQRRHLYASTEVWEWPEGLISAYAINPDDGTLTYLNKQSSMGRLACYLVVDQTAHWLLMAHYMGGNLVVFPIREDGRLGEACFTVDHEGAGDFPGRLPGPHPHCIVIDPTNHFAISADLGLDRVFSYKLDLANGHLAPVSSADLPPGTGPRHFVFHPRGIYGYSTNETNSTLSAFGFDPANGRLTLLQTVPALPADYQGTSHCADIQVHPSGNYLYGANRGHESIVIFAIDPNSGLLTYVGHQTSHGNTPRNFAIDPSGTFMLVANQDSDNIVTFRIDPHTGKLHETGLVTEVPTPCVVKFVDLP